MVIPRLSCTFFSVPDRTAGMFSSVAGGGAVRSAPVMSSARAMPGRARQAARAPMASPAPMTVDRVTAASRSGDRRPCHGRGSDLVLGRAELLLVLGDRGGRERVADHVGGAAPHVEELVDAEDQEQPGL